MDEDIAIPLIFFSFFFAMTWMILNYRKWKYMQRNQVREDSDNSMGLSELKEIMREAVEEANGPLLERIEALEAELRQTDAPRLMPAQRDEILEELKEAKAQQTEPAARRT